MAHRCLLLLGLSLSLLLVRPPSAPARDATTAPQSWQVLDGCTLVESEYHDGDSFAVRHQERIFIVRLYGADALETDTRFPDRLDEQAALFPGLNRTELLRVGAMARAHSESRLRSGPFRVITRFEAAPGASVSQRFYAHVVLRRTQLAVELVGLGFARVHGRIPDGPGQADAGRLRAQLRAAADKARSESKGAWDPRLRDARSGNGRLDLNTASAAEIAGLPGIGNVLAARIVAARPFSSMEDLRKVPGVGPRRLDELNRLAEVRPRRRSPSR